MKNLVGRFQLIFISILLLATFALSMVLAERFNRRTDITQDKLYAISAETRQLLEELGDQPLDVLAFYPAGDPLREELEMFLKECAQHHDRFHYEFYDPNRRPQLAKFWNVHEPYTVVLHYGDRSEKVVFPDEESFSSTLLRLLNPRQIGLCLLMEPGAGVRMNMTEPNGLGLFREALEDHHFSFHAIELGKTGVPDRCEMLLVPGPQQNWSENELSLITNFLDAGKGVLWLIDPMDPGTGKTFDVFFEELGIKLGRDVIVDKASKMVGGDFLMALASQYDMYHSVSKDLDKPAFFPVARSIQAMKDRQGVIPDTLIFSSPNSWAESNLTALENGDAAYDAAEDLLGPVPIAAAREVPGGKEAARLVVVGDSDFISNAYLFLAGNKGFALKAIRWLTKDERAVSLEQKQYQFQPLLLSRLQGQILLFASIFALPLIFLIVGILQHLARRHSA